MACGGADRPRSRHGVSGGLRRTLGVPGVLFLTLSVATPASSVFVIVPGMLQVAGSGALWAMVLAGVVGVATALVYAELSSAFPAAGGEYVMVARTLGPAAGFAMLAVNAVNNLLYPPVAALGVASVLGMAVPGLPPRTVAVAIMAGATLCGVLGIRANARVTGAFLLAEVAALAVVAALGLAHPVRGIAGLLARPMMPGAAGPVPATAGAIGTATSIAIFALNGYGAAVYFSEEMTDAAVRIGRAVMMALAATLLLEAVPLVAGLLAAPDLAAFGAGEDPFGALVAALGGARLGGWVAAGVALAIVNAVIAGVLATARFFYATGRDASWPRGLATLLGAIHPRFASPAGATLLTGALGMLACLLPLRLLLVLSGTGLVAIYAGVALAAFVGRRGGATAHAPYRMPGHPLTEALALAALGYVAWLAWRDPIDGRPGLVATAVQIALALLYYAAVLRPRGWRP